MSKLNQDILDAIKEGKGVDTAMIPGHVSTPTIPEEVLTPLVNHTTGKVYKKVINPVKFVEWIESVAAANLDENQDMSMKSIKGSNFERSCDVAKKEIETNVETVDGEKVSGFRWFVEGTLTSVSLKGEELIDRATNAFAQVLETTIVPIEARSRKLPTVLDPEELNRQEEIVYYMSRRD